MHALSLDTIFSPLGGNADSVLSQIAAQRKKAAGISEQKPSQQQTAAGAAPSPSLPDVESTQAIGNGHVLKVFDFPVLVGIILDTDESSGFSRIPSLRFVVAKHTGYFSFFC